MEIKHGTLTRLRVDRLERRTFGLGWFQPVARYTACSAAAHVRDAHTAVIHRDLVAG